MELWRFVLLADRAPMMARQSLTFLLSALAIWLGSLMGIYVGEWLR